jgi:HK97 gp10 family phage protein
MDVKITGVDLINERFGKLNQAVRDKFLKEAMKATCKPIMEAAKLHCPADLGTLRDSIDMKISSKRTKGTQVRGYVGPKTKFKVLIRVGTRGKVKGKPVIALATRYASQVEFGHRLVSAKGNTVADVKPKPFMRPAWDEEGGDVALNAFADSLTNAIAEWEGLA